jgi:hypothetical protein
LPCARGLWLAALAVSLLSGPALAQDRTAQLRSLFEQQAGAIEKAKLMPRLGEAEFRDARNEIALGRLPQATAILAQYRDQAQLCAQGLETAGRDAEKHPAGFKQLQISLRQSLRRINEILVGLPADDQAPFLAVHKDLDELNRRLIRKLFPRQPVDDRPGKPED